MEAQREGTYLFQLAVESLPQPLMILDPDLRGIYGNPAMCRLTGRGADELSGKRPDDLYPPDDSGRFVPLIERARDERRVQRVLLDVVAPNGETLTMSTTYVPMIGQDGRVRAVLGIGDDVTETTRAERRLERLSRIYQTRSDTTEAIIRSTSEDEMFQRVCEITLGLGGLCSVAVLLHDAAKVQLRHQAIAGPAAELKRDTVIDVGPAIPAGALPAVDAFRLGTAVVNNQCSLNATLLGLGLSMQDMGIRAVVAIPLRSGGEIIGVLAICAETEGYFTDEIVHLLSGMAQDISYGLDHLARARALRASEERYRSLVDNLDDVVYELDAEGRFTFVSRSVARYGFAPEDVVGQRFERFVLEQDMPLLQKNWADSKDGRRTLADVRALDARGKTRFIRGAARPLLEGGRFAGQQGILTDLTERHEIEEQLRTSQKMEAIGRLAGGVAHDFNNLLMVILSYTDFAMEALPAEDPVRADIDEARKASLRAVGLTRQLLAFSRKQVLRPEVLDLNALIGGLEKMLRRLLGEDVELTFVPGANLGAAKADAGQIEQVLLNLVVNARDAMPGGGRLTITTRNKDVDDEYASHHLGMTPGAYVTISVIDTGVGMDEATQRRIFEPFFTTKAAGKGTGLGLATVYGIVKQSGGHIWVSSEVGHGTKFEIFLPLESAAFGVEKRTVSLKPARGTETVLLVEDEEAVRRLTQRILVAAGYKVLPAANGAEALQACASEARIDLLVTDVVMPGMNGRDLWARLKNLRPALKVLYMSGYTDEVIADRGALEPGAPLVGKPFSSDVLLRHVRLALRGS